MGFESGESIFGFQLLLHVWGCFYDIGWGVRFLSLVLLISCSRYCVRCVPDDFFFSSLRLFRGCLEHFEFSVSISLTFLLSLIAHLSFYDSSLIHIAGIYGVICCQQSLVNSVLFSLSKQRMLTEFFLSLRLCMSRDAPRAIRVCKDGLKPVRPCSFAQADTLVSSFPNSGGAPVGWT